ncbi:anaerobic sulfatase maturase [Endozoicomonas sp. (ex Bugula neritina AB1)]|nr:anaerobic sulfatase maturase [Endozoicomonas sp. (ex Bugula neritina AB1)]
MRKPFHLMAKPTSYQCNLDCDYCFYLEKEKLFKSQSIKDKLARTFSRKPDKIFAMSDEVLRTYVKQYIASQDTPTVEFTWQGGEPTTAGLTFFEKGLEYQRKFAGNKQVVNSLQTNGILLNDNWCQFLKDHQFLVGLSIDGPEEIHDHYRVSQGGKPTFKKVMRGVENMIKHGVEFNTLTVINNLNSEKPLEVYNFLKEIGSRYHQYIPVVEQIETDKPDQQLIYPQASSKKTLMPFSVDGKAYGDFMNAIFNEWVRKDVGHIFVQLFDNMLAAWHEGESHLCIHQKSCGRGLVIERNGDIFSCDHFVYPEYKLGNIVEGKLAKMAVSSTQTKFGQSKTCVGKKCEACPWLFACHGGCPKHRLYPNTDGSRQNHLCEGYKAIFKNADPYMRYMSRQLHMNMAPANVMKAANNIVTSH